jgi:ABC-2 type transport system ATP-binding protein
MTRTRSAIAATGLRMSFGDHVVLDGIDLDVAEGTVFALLGPNGAGKTTIVQILSTLIRADAGQVRVAGHDLSRDPDAVRAAIGVTGQFSAVDNLLTGQENLILMAQPDVSRPPPRRRASSSSATRWAPAWPASPAGATSTSTTSLPGASCSRRPARPRASRSPSPWT